MQTVEYYTCGSRDEPEGLTLMTRVVNEDGSTAIGYGEPSQWYKPQQITKAEYESLVDEMRSQPLAAGKSFGLVTPEQREKNRVEQRAIHVALWERRNMGKISLAKRFAATMGTDAANELQALEVGVPQEVLTRVRNGEI